MMPFDCVTTAMAQMLFRLLFLNICINFLIKQVLCTAFRSNVKCAVWFGRLSSTPSYMEQMKKRAGEQARTGDWNSKQKKEKVYLRACHRWFAR